MNLATGAVTGHFPAGSVTLDGVDLIDERPNLVQFTQTQTDRLREPDGVTWVSKTRFATANEGDLAGGSRGFTLFNTDGSVAWDAGMDLEYRLASIGHIHFKNQLVVNLQQHSRHQSIQTNHSHLH